MKIQVKTLICLALCALEVGCSSGKGSSADAGASGASANSNVDPATVGPVTKDDLSHLEALAATNGMMMAAKGKLVSAFITELAKKYGVAREVVSTQIAAIYGLGSGTFKKEDYDPKNVMALNLSVHAIRQDIASANGIGMGPQTDDIKLAVNSQQVKALRSNGMQQALLDLDRLNKEKLYQGQVVFLAIEDQAQKEADALVVSMGGQSKVSDQTVDQAQDLSGTDAKAKALVVAPKLAEMIRGATGATDAKLTATVPYLANSILKYGVAEKVRNGQMKLNLSNASTLQSAQNLTELGGGISAIAENRSQSSSQLASSLDQLSKDAAAISSDAASIAPVQNTTKEVDQDLSEVVSDSRKVIEIGRKLPIDQNIVDTASKAIDVVDVGEKALAAFISPTPSNVIAAVSSLFGSQKKASPDAAILGKLNQMDAKLDKMNAKLDLVTSLQRTTLKELEKTDDDVLDVKNEVLKNAALIQGVSAQIVAMGQQIQNQLSSLGDGEQQLALLEQQSALIQTGADACGRLSDSAAGVASTARQNKSLRSALFSPEQTASLDSCTHFISQLDPAGNVGAMFVGVTGVGGENDDGQTYQMIVNMADPRGGVLPALVFNPVASQIDLSSILTPGTKQLSEIQIPASAQDAMKELMQNYSSGKFALLDAGLVAKYAQLVMQVSSDASLYLNYKDARDGSSESTLDLLADMSDGNSAYQEDLSKFITLLNISIAQQTMMSGVTISNTDLGHVLAPVSGNLDCASHFDFSCLLNKNSDIRKNLLTAGLSATLAKKGSNVGGYDFVLTGPSKLNSPALDPQPLQDFLGTPWELFKQPLSEAKSLCGAAVNAPWISVQIGGQSEFLPCSAELARGELHYSKALYTLLAVRENMLDLMTEMRLGDLQKDHPEQWQQVLRKILVQAL